MSTPWTPLSQLEEKQREEGKPLIIVPQVYDSPGFSFFEYRIHTEGMIGIGGGFTEECAKDRAAKKLVQQMNQEGNRFSAIERYGSHRVEIFRALTKGQLDHIRETMEKNMGKLTLECMKTWRMSFESILATWGRTLKRIHEYTEKESTIVWIISGHPPITVRFTGPNEVKIDMQSMNKAIEELTNIPNWELDNQDE